MAWLPIHTDQAVISEKVKLWWGIKTRWWNRFKGSDSLAQKTSGEASWQKFTDTSNQMFCNLCAWYVVYMYLHVSLYHTVGMCVCVLLDSLLATAPPPAVRSLLTVQPLPGQQGSGKTMWNNLRTVSAREWQETERDYLISFNTCHATRDFFLSL